MRKGQQNLLTRKIVLPIKEGGGNKLRTPHPHFIVDICSCFVTYSCPAIKAGLQISHTCYIYNIHVSADSLLVLYEEDIFNNTFSNN